MSFTSTILQDFEQVGSGEKSGNKGIVLSHATFEDGLNAGLFAKVDTNSIDNLDASATPVIAGVVLRDVAGALEDGAAYTAEHNTHVEFVREGLVTVEAKTGESAPALFADVFAHNVAGADIGTATAADNASTEPTNSEFIGEIKAGVWLIRLK